MSKQEFINKEFAGIAGTSDIISNLGFLADSGFAFVTVDELLSMLRIAEENMNQEVSDHVKSLEAQL